MSNNTMSTSRRNMLKLLAGGAALGGGLMSGLGASLAQQQGKSLRLAHLISESEPTHAAALRWAQSINTRTNGGIDARIFPNSQLGSEKDVVEQSRLGADVANWNSAAFLGEFVPDFEVMWGPFLFKDVSDVQRVAASDLFKSWQAKLLETRGLRVLAFNWYFGARHIMTTNRAIQNPEDLKGLKIRSVPVPVTINMMRQMGASATPLAFAEVYPAMQQGVIDGCEVPLSTMFGSKLYEVGKHISLTGHVIQVQGWTIGEKFFQSLPADIRAIIIEEAVKAGEACTRSALASEADFKKKLQEAGVTVTEPNRAAFEQVGERVLKELSSRWSSGLVDKVRAIKGA